MGWINELKQHLGREEHIEATDTGTGLHCRKPTNLGTYVGGKLVCLKVPIVAAANVTVFNANSPACTIVDAWALLTAVGQGADTLALNDGSADIATCDSHTGPPADGTQLPFIAWDDTKWDLAAGDTLIVVGADDAHAEVIILISLNAS